MEKSESIVNLTKALIKAQSQFGELKKNKKNSHLNYSYADLDSMKNATMPALKNNGLTLNFFPAIIDNIPHLQAWLIHESGEYIIGRYPVSPEKPGMQGTGAAITYLKRYIWGAVFSLYEDENDDAIEESVKKGKISDKDPYEYKTTVSTQQAQQVVDAFNGMSDLWAQIAEPLKIKGASELPAHKFNETITRAQQVRAQRSIKK